MLDARAAWTARPFPAQCHLAYSQAAAIRLTHSMAMVNAASIGDSGERERVTPPAPARMGRGPAALFVPRVRGQPANGAARLGLSYRQAAARVGAAVGIVCQLEQGKRSPSVAMAVALIAGLKLDDRAAGRLMDEAQRDVGRSWTRGSV